MTSGIYKITCVITNKFYIGSSYDIENRFKSHVYALTKQIHCNKYLQRAWNKYGKENFKYEIIEITKDNLLEVEQKWLDDTRCFDANIGYNLCAKTDIKNLNVSRSKTYVVTSPDGIETEVINLEKYCRDNNISTGIRKVATGESNSCNGYLCRYKDDSYEEWTKRKKVNKKKGHSDAWQGTYTITYKNGETKVVKTLYELEKQNYNSLHLLIKGKAKRCKDIIKVVKNEGTDNW